MQRLIHLAAVLSLVALLPLDAALANDADGLGPYVRAGVALGWATTDDGLIGATVSNGVNAGAEIAGGYRITPAFAAEGSFLFVTGGDVSLNGAATGATTQAFAFTADLKVYPLMFGAEDATGFFQPYVRAGLGGGKGELRDAGALTGGQGTFLFRVGGGADLMFTDRFGLYGDGSYYITTEDVLTGVGTIGVGAIVTF